MNDQTKRFWTRYLPLVFLLTVGIFFRVWGAWMFSASYSMDHSVPCLMTKHIAEGHDFPVFYYGQPYMGSIETIAGALFFLLPINHNLACNLGTALFGILLLPLVFIWGRKIGGWLAGLCALAFIVIGPPVYMQFMNWSYGGYAAITFLATALILVALRILEEEQKEAESSTLRLWLLTGFIAGIGWWTSFLLIPFFLTLTILFVIRLRKRCLRLHTLWAGIAFLLGSSPFWLWNIQHHWDSFAFIIKDTSKSNLFHALRQAIDMLLRAITDQPLSLAIYIFAIIISITMLISAGIIITRNRNHTPALYMSAVVLIFIFSLYFFAKKPTRIGPPRYCLALLPVFAVWLGAFTSHVAEKLRRLAPLALLPILILIFFQIKMIPVCHHWYQEKEPYFSFLDKLGNFLRSHDAHIMYAGYGGRRTGYGLNFYFNEEFVFCDPDAKRYLPYLQTAELCTSPDVFKNPYAFNRLLASSGGNAKTNRLDSVLLYHNITPPKKDFIPAEQPQTIIDTKSGIDCLATLSDNNIQTCWCNNRKSSNTLVIRWSKPQTLRAIRLVGYRKKSPELVDLFYKTPNSQAWQRLPEYLFSPWFWTPERYFFGGPFYRQILRLPDITTDTLKMQFNGSNYTEPIHIAELQFFAPTTIPEESTNSFSQLCNLLTKRKIEAVYCDRGLAAKLLGRKSNQLDIALDGEVFPDNQHRLPSKKMRLTDKTVLIEEMCDAPICSNILQRLQISYTEKALSKWKIFCIQSTTHKSSEISAPLRWLGFAPILCDEDFSWRKATCKKIADQIQAGQSDDAKKSIQQLLELYPNYPPAQELLKSCSFLSPTNTNSHPNQNPAWQKTATTFKNGIELSEFSYHLSNAQNIQNQQQLRLRYHWKNTKHTDLSSVAVFVHIKDKAGQTIAQDDHILSDIGLQITQTDRDSFMENRTIYLPKKTATQIAKFEIGLYHAVPPFRRIKIRHAKVPTGKHKKFIILNNTPSNP